MSHSPIRLSILAAVTALGAIGATLALVGLGTPFPFAAVMSGLAAGLVQYGALRSRAAPVQAQAVQESPCRESADSSAEHALGQQLARYRTHTASLRHDLRGVLSPALMMSDRLVNHADPAVQRAGQAVVRSIERATALLASSREIMAPEATPDESPAQPAAAPDGAATPAR